MGTRSDSDPSPDASQIFGKPVAADAGKYVRARDLLRLITLWPHELADPRAILTRLERALRVERRRALAGHWSYDSNRHLGLMAAYEAELAALEGQQL